MKPFHDLLHNDRLFKWSRELEDKFNEIKDMLSSKPSVVIPNTNKPFYISVDASGHGLGAVLFQPNEVTGKMQVISFNSRLLTTSCTKN